MSAGFGKGISRWKRSAGTFSKSRNSKRDTRAERSCSLRPRKAVAFLTHLFRVPRSMGTGISLSADSDSEGCSPSENTSPAALSWSSLFGQTVLKLFLFPHDTLCFSQKSRDTVYRVRRFATIISAKKKHSHRSESAFLVVPCTMAILCSPASPVQRLPLVR